MFQATETWWDRHSWAYQDWDKGVLAGRRDRHQGERNVRESHRTRSHLCSMSLCCPRDPSFRTCGRIQPQSFEVRFCFFWQDGLWVSKAFNLCQEDRFEMFVRAVVGLLSWLNVSEAGMDLSWSDRQFFIADRCLDITDVLCNRRSLRGRATGVYKVRTARKSMESNVEGQTINVVELSQSVECGSRGTPAPISPNATPLEGGIPNWYIQTRSKD